MYRKNMALPFGQYKGVFISDILDTDPGYLLWCMENVQDFDLELSVYEKASINSRTHPDDMNALEDNWLTESDLY